jgi:Ubiquitin family
MAGSKKQTVTVVFNGLEKALEFQPNQQVKALLEHAMNEFGVQANRHIMSLFTEEGAELQDHESVKDAGVKDGDTLVLRPSEVKGGRG